MDRLVQTLVLFVFPLFDLGVKPFWFDVGFPVLYSFVWTVFVDVTWVVVVLHKRRDVECVLIYDSLVVLR